MAAEHHGLLKNTLGNGAPDTSGHVVGFNARDHAGTDMIQQRQVHIKQRAGLHRQIAQTLARSLGQHHVEHGIAVAQMVVKGNRHAALQAAGTDGIG